MALLKYMKRKIVLFGPHFPNCSHGATITFTHRAVYLTELDANIYSQNSGYKPEVISYPKEHLATYGPSCGCHDCGKTIGI